MTTQQKIVAKHFPGRSNAGLRKLINSTIDRAGNVRGACAGVALTFSGRASLDACLDELRADCNAEDYAAADAVAARE